MNGKTGGVSNTTNGMDQGTSLPGHWALIATPLEIPAEPVTLPASLPEDKWLEDPSTYNGRLQPPIDLGFSSKKAGCPVLICKHGKYSLQ